MDERHERRTGRFGPHPMWENLHGAVGSEESQRILAGLNIPEQANGRTLTPLTRCRIAYDIDRSLGQPPCYDPQAVYESASGAFDGCDRSEDMHWAQGHNRGWALKEEPRGELCT